MSRHRYLIIGGGMAADAAVRGIRAVDPEGAIKLISAELDPPYDRPPLSKGLWKGDAPERIWRGTAELGVEMQLGRRVIRVETHNHTVTDDKGTIHGWEKLLLATGGAPRIFPGAPPQLIHFRTWRDYLALRQATAKGKKVAVIGGGFIGSELAAGLATSGKEAKRLFAEGGARINDQVVTEPRLMTLAELQGGLKLTAGRKRHALVRVE